jgi:hypothetical protein
MRKFSIIIMGVICTLIYSSCKKNKTPQEVCFDNLATGRIIGYDPCRSFAEYGKNFGAGFTMERVVNGVKDTVVCYNIPENLYQFQANYITINSSFLFDPNIQNLHKISFYYRNVNPSERNYFICSPLANPADFLVAIKDKEIKISCITKQ